MTARLDCPGWCRGAHRDDSEHVSAGTRLGDLLLEVLRWYPGDEQVYVSLLEVNDGGRYFTLPLTLVPLIAPTLRELVGSPVDTT